MGIMPYFEIYEYIPEEANNHVYTRGQAAK